MIMFSRLCLVIFICGFISLETVAQGQPVLVVPKGYLMISAGLNDKGDLLTLSDSNKLKVWNLDSLKLRYSLDFNTKGSYNAHFSPDGKYLLIPNVDGFTTVLDAASGNFLYQLDGWIQDILKKEVSPDGRYIVTTKPFQRSAKTWELSSGKLQRELAGNEIITYACYNNRGDRIITCDGKGITQLWDPSSGKQLFSAKTNDRQIFCAFFSPDDKYVATASYDGQSTVIETATGAIIAVMKGHTDLVSDLQFSQDNKYIVTASYDKTAAIWNVSDGSKKLDLVGHKKQVLTCRFAENDESVLTSSQDGTMKIWSAKNGRILKSVSFNGAYGTYSVYKNKLILCNSDRINIYRYPALDEDYSLLQLDSTDYLVIDSLGRYDGTEAARKKLYFTCGNEIIDLDQVKDQLWVPNLAERINRGEEINARTLNQLNICDLTPVTETIVSNASLSRFRITPRRGGLGETILFINGIEVRKYSTDQLENKGGYYELTLRASEFENYFIPGGVNRLALKSYTADNSVSSRGIITTNSDTTKRQLVAPKLYAVMVGVSDYKGNDLDLKYAAKDATDISAAIANAGKKMLNTDGKEHVFMYNMTTSANRDGLPEKNSIKKLLEEIGQKTTPNDIVIIFLAGHGVMGKNNNQFYFLTADASLASLSGDIAPVGISTTELIEWMKPQNMKAQKRILILDACNSGQAIKDFVSMGQEGQGYMAARNDEKSQQIKAIDKLNEKSGLFILAASASNQSAYEMGRFSQGLLTYALLKAIKHQPDILTDGKYLDVSRWFNAAEKTVSELTRNNTEKQQPQIVSNTNFNVGLVDDEVLNKIILPQEKPLLTNSNLQNNDEALAFDDLGINRLLDNELAALSGSETGNRLVFIPGAHSADAWALGGRYILSGNTIRARLNLRQGYILKHRFELTGTTEKIGELVKAIAAQVLSLVK